jgi:hypothetical protein
MEELKVKQKIDKKEYQRLYRLNNQDKIKAYREANPDYNKEYRKKNLDKIKALFATKIKCKCGKEVQQYHLNKHLVSGNHYKALAEQN